MVLVRLGRMALACGLAGFLVATPCPALAAPDGHPRLHVEAIRSGDSVASTLIRAGVRPADAQAAANSVAPHLPATTFRAGRDLRITFLHPVGGGEPRFLGFVFQSSLTRDVIVRREAAGFTTQAFERPVARELIRSGRAIQTSFYQTALDAGVPGEMVGQLIRVFSYDVDFQRDIQPGDRFEVLWEGLRDEAGKVIRATSLRYAALHLRGRTLALYRFEHGGEAGWYDAQGRSVRKALLRTPVDAAAIVSGFGMRMHPILGYSRMHQGVDFAASHGARIMASGDGIIEAIGPNGDYGNYIRIRHVGTLATAYAHLSRFAPGLKIGSMVRQGQVIGYVGSTGMSTGPHLHYEMLVAGRQVDPARHPHAATRQLAGQEMVRFQAELRAIEADRQRRRDPFAPRPDDVTVAHRVGSAVRGGK